MSVVVRPKRCRCSSWACPGCARVMGPVLQNRLESRLQTLTGGGHYKTIMVTLTFDRKRFESPLDAWRFARRNRVVCRAMKSFAADAGYNVSGLWFAKMELQKAGWPHWHVALIVPAATPISKESFNEHWRYGFSNVRDEYKPSYLCKYAVKSAKEASGLDTLRLSNLPEKRVQWVSCSRGFWGAEGDDVEKECEQALLWDDEVPHSQGQSESFVDDNALHVDRVAWCRGNSVLEFETKGGTLTLPVALPRAALAETCVERGEGLRGVVRYPDSGVVRSFGLGSVRKFLAWLEFEFAPAGVVSPEDLSGIRRALLAGETFEAAPPDESPPRDKASVSRKKAAS